jgi:hypothetical protein
MWLQLPPSPYTAAMSNVPDTTGAKRDAAGFRLRGLEMTRIETFTDAAFAFALTLLAISLDPLTTLADLRDALRGVPAFLLSATMLMMFWWGHHEWSRRYGMDDRRTFVLSCLLVFTMLVYVYPLRFMFGLMMAWLGNMVGIELGSDFSAPGADRGKRAPCARTRAARGELRHPHSGALHPA